MSRYGESSRTTIASGSVVSEAIGVTSPSPTGALLVAIAPTITRPITMSSFARRRLRETSCARPIVPPAPATL